ncbi:MAG: hypothetical protein OES69_13190 [Myxococcales bacterium]|nr:hypothetical protein [Myxococcales bacterium]MDH3844891.1 hypothetical protein [Myxococcales bacterium]
MEPADLHHSILTELRRSGSVEIDGTMAASFIANDPRKEVADATTKSFIKDKQGNLVAVLLVSNSVNPFLVERSVSRAMAARQVLGPDLGRVILEPLADGTFQGLTYVLWPAQRNLAPRGVMRLVERRGLAARVRIWLRKIAKHTRVPATGDDLTRAYLRPLEAVSEDRRFSAEIRQRSRTGLSRLSTGEWRPFVILEHNDLWLGNFLLPRDRAARKGNPYRFFVIDWAGAAIQGHPFYDLLRFGLSAGIPTRIVAEEVLSHCRILECQPHDVAPYLIASLGTIGMNLEHFPEHRYVEMSNAVIEQMNAILDSLKRQRSV